MSLPKEAKHPLNIQYDYVAIPHSEWWNPILKGYISCILGPLAPTLGDQLTKTLRPLRLDFCFGPTAPWKWQWPLNFLHEFPSQGISFQEQIGWIYMNFKNVVLHMVSSLDVCLPCVFAGGYIHVYTQCSRYFLKTIWQKQHPEARRSPINDDVKLEEPGEPGARVWNSNSYDIGWTYPRTRGFMYIIIYVYTHAGYR